MYNVFNVFFYFIYKCILPDVFFFFSFALSPSSGLTGLFFDIDV